jgi:hypothetical protein
MSRKELIGAVACLLGLIALAVFVGADKDSVCLHMLDPGLKAQMSDADRAKCEAVARSR